MNTLIFLLLIFSFNSFAVEGFSAEYKQLPDGAREPVNIWISPKQAPLSASSSKVFTFVLLRNWI